MKKIFKNFFVSALMVLISVTLVACTGNKDDNELNQAPFGNAFPDRVNVKYKINSSMDALEMYEIGVKNFNEQKFVASNQQGKIATKTPIGTMVQKLDSIKIKQNNINYLDSYTYTIKGGPAVNIIDQSIYQNGKYRVRSADKLDIKDETPIIKTWKPVEKFNSLKDGLKKYPNDPTRINMFIVDEDTVIDYTKPEYDAKNKTYSFDMDLDVDYATEDYLANMYYNVEKGGLKNAKITFTTLKLHVTMWSNGLIKEISTDESYEVKGSISIINATNTTSFVSSTYFTYDAKEININDYLKF